MNSAAALRRPCRSSSLLTAFQTPIPSRLQLFASNQGSFLLKPNRFAITSRQICSTQFVRTRDSSKSSDGGRGSNIFEAPSAAEFITSERIKVVAMLALALALCNADRVVMSVAIVPIASSNGWSQSFAGVIQSSFLWGYLISLIAGGTLVDRYGGAKLSWLGVSSCGLWQPFSPHLLQNLLYWY